MIQNSNAIDIDMTTYIYNPLLASAARTGRQNKPPLSRFGYDVLPL